jgi:transposase
MRKLKEVLRLRHQGLSLNAIAGACQIARSTVQDYVRRADAAGLGWPLPEVDEPALDGLLFAIPPEKGDRPLPDWDAVHQELSRKGVTLSLLWQEYKQQHPTGYAYTQFCLYYQRWAKKTKVVMRQEHKAGEKTFVDFAGQTMAVIDPSTGEASPVQIFVATLGASSFTFACAVPGQDLESWLSCHIGAFRYFGGLTEIVVPDNLKAGVKKACRYEPDINPSYQELAEHYGVAVLPARAGKPRDKAKVEVAVQVVERWVLAPLRNRKFFSLSELNAAMSEKLDALNDRTMKEYGKTRRELFELWDRPALKPLPQSDYEIAFWKKATVNIDYHIEIEKHYYSVPYTLASKMVEVRYTASTIEVFHHNRRVASHLRSYAQYKHTTRDEHMPRAHQEAQTWSAGRITAWARKIGPETLALVLAIIGSRQHPEQGYRSCLGLLRLEKTYGATRLERACARALRFGMKTRRHVLTILENKQDLIDIPDEEQAFAGHSNIRGASFYQ